MNINYGYGFLSDHDAALSVMTAVSNCTQQNADELRQLEKYFCMLDNDGDSVLKHAIKANNHVALDIIYKSKHFHTIKGIQNKGGEYAVFTAAVEGKVDILRQLLSQPNNCRIMPPVCKKDAAPSILHEVIGLCRNSTIIFEILLDDLRNRNKYSADEVKYIISFHGNVDDHQYVDAYDLALGTGRHEIAEMLVAFIHEYFLIT